MNCKLRHKLNTPRHVKPCFDIENQPNHSVSKAFVHNRFRSEHLPAPICTMQIPLETSSNPNQHTVNALRNIFQSPSSHCKCPLEHLPTPIYTEQIPIGTFSSPYMHSANTHRNIFRASSAHRKYPLKPATYHVCGAVVLFGHSTTASTSTSMPFHNVWHSTYTITIDPMQLVPIATLATQTAYGTSIRVHYHKKTPIGTVNKGTI
jgi:hypothetical protein